MNPSENIIPFIILAGMVAVVVIIIHHFIKYSMMKEDKIYCIVKSKNPNDNYVTFENRAGKRIVLSVSGVDYGYLAEGDRGYLKMKGNLYWGFDREI